MTKFYLKMNKLNDSIDGYYSFKRNAMEDIDSCYELLSNLDSVWVDNNSDEFRSLVKRDKNVMNEYFECLTDFYGMLESFRDNLSYTLKEYGYSSNSTIEFDNNRLQECLTLLDDAESYLDSAIRTILDIVYPSNFTEFNLAMWLKDKLYELKNKISSDRDSIYNFSKSIVDDVNTAKEAKSKLGTYNAKFENIDYTWSNVYLDESANNASLEEHDAEIAKGVEQYKPDQHDASNIGDGLIYRKSVKNEEDYAEVPKSIANIGDGLVYRQSVKNEEGYAEVPKSIANIGDNMHEEKTSNYEEIYNKRTKPSESFVTDVAHELKPVEHVGGLEELPHSTENFVEGTVRELTPEEHVGGLEELPHSTENFVEGTVRELNPTDSNPQYNLNSTENTVGQFNSNNEVRVEQAPSYTPNHENENLSQVSSLSEKSGNSGISSTGVSQSSENVISSDHNVASSNLSEVNNAETVSNVSNNSNISLGNKVSAPIEASVGSDNAMNNSLSLGRNAILTAGVATATSGIMKNKLGKGTSENLNTSFDSKASVQNNSSESLLNKKSDNSINKLDVASVASGEKINIDTKDLPVDFPNTSEVNDSSNSSYFKIGNDLSELSLNQNNVR